MLKGYNEMKEEIKNPENIVEHIWKHWKRIMSIIRKTLQTKILVTKISVGYRQVYAQIKSKATKIYLKYLWPVY